MRVVGDLPRMAVRVDEDARVAAPERLRAGARDPRSGAETFWGGYSGIFVDPDGHPWEVAHNPGWTIGDDGSTTLSP